MCKIGEVRCKYTLHEEKCMPVQTVRETAIVPRLDGSKPISFASVQNRQPDRTYFIRKLGKDAHQFLAEAADEFYYSIVTTLSIDELSRNNFNQYIWPVVSSGAALAVGELATAGLNLAFPAHNELEVIFKFLLGISILSYSAMQRLTDKCPKTLSQLSAAIASEVLAVTCLYSSTFRGSQMLLQEHLSETATLIASLGLSTLAVPEAIAYLAQKTQEKLIKRDYERGAQRSDTAIMPSGLTPVSNIFFQSNHFVRAEIATLSRLFQLGLISNNVLHAAFSDGTYAAQLLHQFRNLPALITDTGPPVLKSLLMQQIKIATDYQHNTAKQKVLRFTELGPDFLYIERCQLRNGDLVSCDENFNFDSVPVSGEVVSFVIDSDGKSTIALSPKKISINLKAHNGEDVWIESTTSTVLTSQKNKVDLHHIRDGKQAGILAGAKLNLNGNENCYIRIQDQTERTFSSNYEKKAVINQIVSDQKQRQVIYSMMLAGGMAALQAGSLANFPATAFRLLFNLSQMMIPFSETFLREMVNGRLMKDINRNLADTPMEIVDALRVVDFFNARTGYYHNRFPHGMAIVSDKTGTLTTAKMNVLGCWTQGMPAHVQAFLQEKAVLLPEESQTQLAIYEIFAEAFTHSKQAVEPEEFAILEMFRRQIDIDDYLKKISILGNNHFKKTIATAEGEKLVETIHLGLYRSLGGRFTLVNEGEHNYLVFCGVPKADPFKDTPLLHAYAAMQVRTGVLSRDWCVARAPLSDAEFTALNELFSHDKKTEIHQLLCSILCKLIHYGTFLIDNPVKKGVEQFISNCRHVNVPVFIATGDTAKSAENIEKVLCEEDTQHIITIRDIDIATWEDKVFPAHSTVIFAGINPEILGLFQKIVEIDIQRRPVVIFSEMSTENKGVLARYLKDHGFFVAANGDGTNDVAMMREADVVFAHVTDEGNYAPGVEQFANLSDRQLRELLNSQDSFYELFDIHKPNSALMRLFAPLANSQEKPIVALSMKSVKIGSELAKSVGIEARDIPGLHWFGVIFDLIWLLVSFMTINASTDLPMDSQSLDESPFPNRCMVFALTVAVFQAVASYEISGESTNLTWMMLMLALLPILLRSIFAGFGQVQEEELDSSSQFEELPDNYKEPVTQNKPAVQSGQEVIKIEHDRASLKTDQAAIKAEGADTLSDLSRIPRRQRGFGSFVSSYMGSFFSRQRRREAETQTEDHLSPVLEQKTL